MLFENFAKNSCFSETHRLLNGEGKATYDRYFSWCMSSNIVNPVDFLISNKQSLL